MREVKVKFHVRDREALLLTLKARGIDLGEPFFQDDQAYAPDRWTFADSRLGVSFPRLRTINNRHFFALRRPTVNAQACDAYETEVADRDQMHQAILNMGFCPTVRVAKTRRTARVGDVSLCVDELDGLGMFLELDCPVPAHESVVVVQEALNAFVTSLCVDVTRTEETCDALVRTAQLRAA
ncbi:MULTISPECIES: class IV adenylate cyclase [unclassified Frankia]|uniref:class IV adenylate cyclase n=1 Tax=unclassified Frankia TaxID=2632575 RepID=UPI002AD4A635|nr:MULTISPECIES: CYTH domain-containing protein [unclassified Frankia]